MNQTLLTRLFKTIEGKETTPLIKIAYSIIEDEKRKGHSKLADKLAKILNDNLSNKENVKPTFKIAKDGTYNIPVDRRYKLPLTTHIEHDALRHEMVLSPEINGKIIMN